MPELPEVERGRKIAEASAKNSIITDVWLADDDIVFDRVPPSEFKKALIGRRVLAVKRRGKQLWFELDERPWPLFHFGMTGAFLSKAEDAFQLETGPEADKTTWPPRFSKIVMRFDRGTELVMVNSRRFGRIRLREDPETEEPISKLGFDPLEDLPDLEAFSAAVSRRKGSVKGLLLDQKFAAGVGNWIADEVLFQARLAPARPANSLDPHEISSLREKLHSVVAHAVNVNADKEKFPKDWLFHHRWSKGKLVSTEDGHQVVFEKIAGRTTAWVPFLQK